MEAFTRDLRLRFKGLDDIYVWHALCGAWNGVRPETMTHLKAKVVPFDLSPGLDATMPDLAVDKIVEAGIGLVHPSKAHEFYDSMHSYLASVGVTGAKIDVFQVSCYITLFLTYSVSSIHLQVYLVLDLRVGIRRTWRKSRAF